MRSYDVHLMKLYANTEWSKRQGIQRGRNRSKQSNKQVNKIKHNKHVSFRIYFTSMFFNASLFEMHAIDCVLDKDICGVW